MYLEVGWGKLEIHTSPNVTDEAAATAAGKLEGTITAKRTGWTGEIRGARDVSLPSLTYNAQCAPSALNSAG